MKRKSMRKFAEHGGYARVLAFVTWRIMRPVLWLLLTLASMVMLPLQQFARVQVLETGLMNIGISPTSMQIANLPQAQAVHHDKKFVKNLKANTPGLRICNRRELPEMSGNQHRLYMYQALGANTVQQAEGTVSSGIQISVVNNTSTIGQYADYVNMSDISIQTSIDPALENIQKELAYRLGLTLTTLVRNTADGANAIDSSVSSGSLAFNVPFTKSSITTGVQSLANKNVQPFDRGRMTGLISPLIVGDALNDAANNSLTDILKRSPEGMEKLSELPSPDGDQVPVLEWAGVSFHQTTLITPTANYQSSGKTAVRTYITGEDALIAISLGKTSQGQIGDGDYRNLKLWMYKFTEPDRADPSRVIGGLTSYNVKFVVTLPPDTTMRMRIVDAVPLIA